MISKRRKIYTLLWKCFKQLRHSYFDILWSFGIPICLLLAVTLTSVVLIPQKEYNDTIFEPFDLVLDHRLHATDLLDEKINTFIWSPCNLVVLGPIVDEVSKRLMLHNYCVRDSATLEVEIRGDTMLCGIDFGDVMEGEAGLNELRQIQFRFPAEVRLPTEYPGITTVPTWFTNDLFPLDSMPGPRDPESNEGANPVYQAEGFLTLQNVVSLEIIKAFMPEGQRSKFIEPVIKMQRLPYPQWQEEKPPKTMKFEMQLIVFMLYAVPVCVIVKDVTTEKEAQVKTLLKIMGMNPIYYWISTFAKCFILLSPADIVLIIVLKLVLPSTSIILVSVLVLLFNCAVIAMSFAVSAIYTNPTIAQAAAMVIHLIPMFFYHSIHNTRSLLVRGFSYLLCFIALDAGVATLVDFQSDGIVLSVGYIVFNEGNNFNIMTIYSFLIMDTLLYILFTLYFEAVISGPYEVPKPWYFPINPILQYIPKEKIKNCRLGIRKLLRLRKRRKSSGMRNQKRKSAFEEELIEDTQVGINITKLTKWYSGGILALDEVSMKMYRGQITVILGHNGAGKSTLIKILSGSLKPTSGTAKINGYDVRTEMSEVRKELGFCLQRDILFVELNVSEHIELYCKMKGLSKEETKKEIDYYSRVFLLNTKMNVKISNLSEGMKRRLCSTIALCAGSKFVFLDEPTSNLDLRSRRAFMDVLQKEKRDRIIVITTHFLDEADYLGDKIAILCNGQLQGCGAGSYLKNRFSNGYNINLTANEYCRVDVVTNLIKRHVPNVAVKKQIGSHISYCVSEDYVKNFSKLLKELESNSKKIGVISYEITTPSLEDALAKLSPDARQRSDTSSVPILITGKELLTGRKLFVSQLSAVFMKRIMLASRMLLAHLVQIFMPIFWIVIGLTLSENTEIIPVPVCLNLSYYDDPITVIGGSNNLYKGAYKQYLFEEGYAGKIIDIGDDDFHQVLLEMAKEDIYKYRSKLIIGAKFSDENIIAYFNNEPYHSPPVALYYVHEAIASKEIGDFGRQISFCNYPISQTLSSKMRIIANVNQSIPMKIMVAIVVSFSLFIIMYVGEKALAVKKLQYSAGLNICISWLGNIIWDFVVVLDIAVVCVVTLILFQKDGYRTEFEIGRCFLLVLLVGLSVLSMTYVISFFITIPVNGFTIIIISGFVGIILEITNPWWMDHDYKFIFFVISPYILFSESLRNMYRVYLMINWCSNAVDHCIETNKVPRYICEDSICTTTPCCDIKWDYYSWSEPGMGLAIAVFLLEFLLGVIFIFIVEYGLFKTIRHKVIDCFMCQKQIKDEPTTSEVNQERERVHNMSQEDIKNYAVIIKDLTKYHKSFLCLKKLNLAIKKNECFGLLGPNGAGKTTLLKLLAHESVRSFGQVIVNKNIIKGKTNVQSNFIGYCPQFGGLFSKLTPKEMLVLFSMYRGLPEDIVINIAEKTAIEFGFSKEQNWHIEFLSSGIQRKLSIALAFIGDPPIVLLDEPTTGMDISSKHFVWNHITSARGKGQTIILSSNSMEECEILCTRMAILINGQFVTTGSVQFLKSKYSSGYLIMIKVKQTNRRKSSSSDLEDIENFIKDNIPDTEVIEITSCIISFEVQGSALLWHELFQIVEEAKTKFNCIESYSVGINSPDNAYLNLSKKQRRTSIFVRL